MGDDSRATASAKNDADENATGDPGKEKVGAEIPRIRSRHCGNMGRVGSARDSRSQGPNDRAPNTRLGRRATKQTIEVERTA